MRLTLIVHVPEPMFVPKQSIWVIEPVLLRRIMDLRSPWVRIVGNISGARYNLLSISAALSITVLSELGLQAQETKAGIAK